ncbi:MAG: Hpt domain-containing protein, partial [Treponema sp.]
MAKISSDITESYIAEIGELIVEFKNDVLALKAAPKDEGILSRLLRNLHTMKGNSRMLGFSCVERLSHSVEDVYKSVKDGKIRNSDRLVQLVSVVADKIMECVAHIKRTGSDAMNIDIYLQYCDKIAAGELVDLDAFTADVSRVESDEDAEDDAPVSDIQSIRIKLSRVNEIISSFDTMITREFRLKHQLDEI